MGEMGKEGERERVWFDAREGEGERSKGPCEKRAAGMCRGDFFFWFGFGGRNVGGWERYAQRMVSLRNLVVWRSVEGETENEQKSRRVKDTLFPSFPSSVHSSSLSPASRNHQIH